jgi:hypothetical protein
MVKSGGLAGDQRGGDRRLTSPKKGICFFKNSGFGTGKRQFFKKGAKP